MSYSGPGEPTSNVEPHPGLGSGALREALEQIASITCSCHDSADANWHGKRCPKGIALAALSLSSPTEPRDNWPTIREAAKAILVRLGCVRDDGDVPFPDDVQWVSEIIARALPISVPSQASSEIRERPNLLSSIPLATGRDSATRGWTVDPAFLLEVRELLGDDERVDLAGIESIVLALNKLQTKRALAPSRQGAGGK